MIDVAHKNVLYSIAVSIAFAVLVRAQFGKYGLPSPEYTPCFLNNGTQKSYCPPNTTCVPSQVPGGMYPAGVGPEDTVLAEYTAPGCCSEPTDVACVSPASNVYAPACCPNATSICCFASFLPQMPFIGCAEDIRQCCGVNVCPTGYSCCARDSYSYCCPGLESCSALRNETYQALFDETQLKFVPNSYNVSAPSLQVSSRELIYTPCARVENNTRVEWAEDEAYPCGREGSWCLNGTYTSSNRSDICYNSVGTPVNATGNLTVFEEAGDFCCPADTTACTRVGRHRRNGGVFGCADESVGEECCGNQVCGSTSKCCRTPTPQSWATEPNSGLYTGIVNATEIEHLGTTKCCPTGTFCCALLLPSLGSNFDTADRIFTYCGRNENCTSMATVSESAQPLKGREVLPDYIESLGWLTGSDSTEYFAQQPQNSCGCADISDNCKSSCVDQLEFKLNTNDCT